MNETMNIRVPAENKIVPVTVGSGAKAFEAILWVPFIIPGVIFQMCKLSSENYLHSLEQKILHHNSQIQNYLEQRVIVLKNCARLLDRSEELDKTVFERLAQYRTGTVLADEQRNRLAQDLDVLSRSIQATVENYPDLRSHDQIRECMRQNLYLQQEITAARDLYNQAVYTWNREIFAWITNRIVASRKGYTTRLFFETGYVEPEDTFF